MLSRRTVTLAALTLALVPALARPATADDAARRLLEAIYKTYRGNPSDGLDYDTDAKVRRYFTPDTARLFIRDRREAKGEVGRIDFDPFIEGQDWEVTAVAVSVAEEGPERATGTVRLTNMGKPQTVLHDLVRTPDGWRIHDIRWPGRKDTLRSILARPTI
jgi:hypothetical protein